jgi:hypothetical protein
MTRIGDEALSQMQVLPEAANFRVADQPPGIRKCRVSMSAKACWQQLILQVMAFRRALCGFALQIPGCWVTRTLRWGKNAAAQLREFFLGKIALKTPGYWQSLERTHSGT